MKKIFYLLTILLLSTNLNAQISVIEKGKPKGRIIINQSEPINQEAANLLNHFLKEISGTELSIVSESTKIKKGDILIGLKTPENSDLIKDITEDGFLIQSNSNNLSIIGDQGKGALYGVVSLLEDYQGIRYLKEQAYTLTPSSDVSFPENIIQLENPSFKYRQTQAYSTHTDPIYKIWHRLEEPQEEFAAGYWVHTFNKLLPAAEYGEEHPEYYAFFNGQRHPGTVSQWCLTNDEVFDIVVNRIDSIFKANPDKHIISVSQNDSQIYCQCEKCKAIIDKEGTPAGPIIYFLNKLAQKYPDKEFSTLAYLFSVPAPKYIKPLPNVNIMLCDIDAYREVTLTENPSGQEFVKEMEAWSKITNNIYVWDYGINFDNYVAPFPNFHILQPNMKLFKKNGATRHFSQIAGSKGGDFSELRSYIVSKLLWNVNADVESIMKGFLKDFYGEAAAPYIYDYIKLREGALLGSQIPLWIYDTPVTHKEGMLNDQLMRRYNQLFDKAEDAVKNDPIYLARVREERLPLQYSELEIIRTRNDIDKSNLGEKVELFRNRAAEYGVVSLNERRNFIEDYCKQYIERNLPATKQSLALGADILFVDAPNKPYDEMKVALTDGLYGGATFNDGWVGWEGRDGEFIIDLGETKDIQSVETDFLHKLGSWVLLPKNIQVSTSIDNKKYTEMGSIEIPEDKDIEVKFVTFPIRSNQKVTARYIRIKVGTIGLCPTWHYGVGHPAWFFIDEVNVY